MQRSEIQGKPVRTRFPGFHFIPSGLRELDFVGYHLRKMSLQQAFPTSEYIPSEGTPCNPWICSRFNRTAVPI
jgi:hypothetical protein